MSLAELRKELKSLRKTSMPVPVSRMKKADCAAEIARLKGMHHTEVKKVEEVMKKEEVPKRVAKKVKAVQETEHKKQEGYAKEATTEVVKKTKGVKAPKEEPKAEKPKAEKASKPEKGSAEMKERMAKLRELRKKKAE